MMPERWPTASAVIALLLLASGGCGSKGDAQATAGTAPPPTGQAASGAAPNAAPAAPPSTAEGERYQQYMRENPNVKPYAR